ncbi:hypothetical protein EVAR_71210_1 [Eumeta japonica]|uniref:Ig-like domain-containing protein n=1 Tax=Eumeta variegata TaxID=151549 RepID=A0A4C2A6A3_EUMVA|nr:hypothetical protein EVAR_71210_1 [Eumeta japonica]
MANSFVNFRFPSARFVFFNVHNIRAEITEPARREPAVGPDALGCTPRAVLPPALRAGVSSVRIIRMKVPDVIQLGTVDAVTLDCEYVTKNVTGLVVKWFFMDKSQPVYQWIPPQKPQALGLLRNKLDLSVRVSHNPYTQHRALRILAPGTELTGNYTCVVSTFLAEDQRTSPMVIFALHPITGHRVTAGRPRRPRPAHADGADRSRCLLESGYKKQTLEKIIDLVPEKRFTMVLDRLDDEYLNIICSVEAVFPSPNLTILVGSRPINAKQTVSSIKNRYTAVTSSVLRVSNLPSTVEELCELHVPLANYISRKRDIFYRDPPAAGPEPPDAPTDRAALGKGYISRSAPAPFVAAVLINLLRSHFQYT